jgi:hypothetical protein
MVRIMATKIIDNKEINITPLSKCQVSVFIPKKLVMRVSGSIKAENTVRYLMVEFVLSSKILLRVSSMESIFSWMMRISL